MSSPVMTEGLLLDPSAVQELATNFRDHDDARAVYNTTIDKRPALITQCVDVADLIAAVTFARARRLPLTIRSGGHNGAEVGAVEDGLGHGVRMDPVLGAARVEDGAKRGDLHHAAKRFGLTRREVEVLRLLRKRQTDKEIAAALFLGPRTIQSHVAHILAKLDAANRREAALKAEQLGLC